MVLPPFLFESAVKLNSMTSVLQAKAPAAKKIKKKENGIQLNNKSNKKKRMKPLKSSMRLSSSEKSRGVSV